MASEPPAGPSRSGGPPPAAEDPSEHGVAAVSPKPVEVVESLEDLESARPATEGEPVSEGRDQAPWQMRIEGENDRDVLILCSFVVLMAFVLNPTPARDGVTIFGARLPEVCGVKRMGWGECPGCGLTRSFILGVRLNPEAFDLHPAGPILLLIVAAQIPFRGYRMWRRRRLARDSLVDLGWGGWEPFWKALRWSIVLVIVGGWVLRMGWIP